MKKLAWALVLSFLVALAFVVAGKRAPTLPDMQDRFGLLPVIPGEKRSIEELEQALGSADSSVRREALRSFGRLLDHGQLPASRVQPLLLEAVKDESPGVRAVGAAYLRQPSIDAATVIPVLVSLLKDPDALVRRNAAMGLAAHWAEAKPAVPALVEALNDHDPDVRRQAASALVRFPEIRYAVPEDWRRMSPQEARGRARSMGLAPLGETLHEAVRYNDIAGVFLLLKGGVDPNSRSSSPAGETPLFLLTSSTRPEITRLLLANGAGPLFKDSFGRQPLDWVSGGFREEAPGWEPFGKESLELLRDGASALAPD